jgi:hypothetical protein
VTGTEVGDEEGYYEVEVTRDILRYSPNDLEEVFSEVRGSKQPTICGGKYSTTSWRRRFDVETRRIGTLRCTFFGAARATKLK